MRCCLLLLRLFLLLNIRMRHIHTLPLLQMMYFPLSFLLCSLCLRGRYMRNHLLLLVLSFLSLLFLLRLPGYTTLFLLFRTRLLRFRCSIFVLCLPVYCFSLFSFLFHHIRTLPFDLFRHNSPHLILQVISVISLLCFHILYGNVHQVNNHHNICGYFYLSCFRYNRNYMFCSLLIQYPYSQFWYVSLLLSSCLIILIQTNLTIRV